MSESKENQVPKESNFLHRYYNIFFIILFIISLLSFSIIYFHHTKNVEKRFDNALKSYEQSLSNIFNNLSIETNNYTNESTVSKTSSSCTSTRDRISINNNNIMNMISSEGDGFDELEKSFEIGLDLLKASLSEIMKNSNDVLTFWFAFLSVIMVVFTFAGILINNNVLEQSKIQLKFVEKEAQDSIKNIKEETKIEIQKLIDENNKYIRISQLFNFGEDSGRNKDYNSVIKYNLEIIKLYGDIKNIKDKNHINNYAGAFYNIGTAKYELKDYDESIEYLNKAIEINPYFSIAYVYRGIAYYQLGKYKDALKDYNEAIDLNFNNEYAYTNRGLVKEKLGDDKGALEDYNKAIELNQSNVEAYTNRGFIKEKLEDYQGALNDYNNAIYFNSMYYEPYINRALLNIKLYIKNNDKELFKSSYDDLIIAYNLSNIKNKDEVKRKIIHMAKNLKIEVAIKFCEDKGWDIK
ncbi:tetratricopeptide repeat protein [Brachyspira pilosicoli]|uniref:tetratricopeptide repeat protein n=1 Tax=Brachyspira pilosicoli TaxID=52584 RepID=UPI001CA4E7A1|nr:tetratricopeptide repeat protein [Brachyspira pilosicoli]MBW5382870.1 tetratricopeptide repeat protein [Brachyspira pilosicoli]